MTDPRDGTYVKHPALLQHRMHIRAMQALNRSMAGNGSFEPWWVELHRMERLAAIESLEQEHARAKLLGTEITVALIRARTLGAGS